MAKKTACKSCGASFFTVEGLSPDPINHDECPNCGHTEFEPVE